MLMRTTLIGTPESTHQRPLSELPRQAKLTAKQSKFVHCVADGMSLIAAYRACYATQANDKVVSVSSNELMRNPKIHSAILAQMAQKTHESKLVSTQVEAKLFLVEQLMAITSHCQDESLRFKALELLAASLGIVITNDHVLHADKAAQIHGPSSAPTRGHWRCGCGVD